MRLVDIGCKQKLDEYFTGWEVTDHHEIRAHVIESLVEWCRQNPLEEGLFINILPAYMLAIGAKANESHEMADALRPVGKMLVKEFKNLLQDEEMSDIIDGFGLDVDITSGLEQLKQLGVAPNEVAAIEKSYLAMKAEQEARGYDGDDDDDEDLEEAEVWDKPNPKKKHKKLSPEKKAAAKARAKRAGRPYPNLIDNMWASKR